MKKILELIAPSRWPLVALLTLGLAGCLISKAPLISRSERPFKDYVLLQEDRWDKVTREWQLVDNMMAVSATANGYVLQKKNEPDAAVLIATVAPRQFVIQGDGGALGGAQYVALVVGTDGRWYFRSYQDLQNCSDIFTQEQINRLGLTTEKLGDGPFARSHCFVPSLQSLVTAMQEDLRNRPNGFDVVYRVIRSQ